MCVNTEYKTFPIWVTILYLCHHPLCFQVTVEAKGFEKMPQPSEEHAILPLILEHNNHQNRVYALMSFLC